MGAITDNQFRAAFQLAGDVARGRLFHAEAVDRLQKTFGMNRSSAKDYIGAYQQMIAGNRFMRSIKAPAVRYFLSEIEKEFGSDGLAVALKSLKGHIDYSEKIGGRNCVVLTQIYREFESGFADFVGLPEDQKFSDDVENLSRMTTVARRSKLPPPGYKPTETQVLMTRYLRSAAVVAETLIRANGICETCKRPAPFSKASDGQPFLEVHHIVMLADGGDDTVENAIAVCPNCHRQHHFGYAR
jgi:5-methylcytosine-specific restriction enzyme A